MKGKVDNGELRPDAEFSQNFVCLQFDVIDVEKNKRAVEEFSALLVGDRLPALMRIQVKR